MSINIQLLSDICEIPGAPGFENRIRDFVLNQITSIFNSHQVSTTFVIFGRSSATSYW